MSNDVLKDLKKALLDGEWKDEAACKDLDPDDFFDNFEKAPEDKIRRRTLSICNTLCKVREECFEYAKLTKSTGVFGGHYFWIGRPIKDSVKFKRIGD